MKKIVFALLILCINSIWVACGDDTDCDIEIPQIDSISENLSSSSEAGDKSSCSSETDKCGFVVATYKYGWPGYLMQISSLKEVSLYGNDFFCDPNKRIKTATLYYEDRYWHWEMIGTVEVTAIFDENNGNVGQYIADFSIFDEQTPFADGLYQIVWKGEYENPVQFYLVRDKPNFYFEILWKSNEDIEVNARFPDAIFDIKYRGYLIDTVHGKTYPIAFDSLINPHVLYTCKLNEYVDTLADGAYKVRWEFFSTRIAPDSNVYNNIINNDSAAVWSYVVDSDGNMRDGVYGLTIEKDFFLDRTTAKIVDVLKSEYSVKANDSITVRNFNVKLKLYDNLLGRKSELLKVTCRARGVYAYRDLIDLDKDTVVVDINFKHSIKSYKDIFLDIYIEDENKHIDSVRIENFDVVDSLFVKNTLDRIPVEISYKNYDCTQYKCVSTIYLNPDIDYGEFLDVRDSQVYKTVQIGNQTWMAQNLNFETESSSYTDGLDSSEIHGRVYTWNDAVGVSMEDCPKDSICSLKGTVQGVCPEGWHVPSFDEFRILKNTVTELYDSKHDLWGSRLLKSQYGWNEGYSTNETGLSIIPTNKKKTEGALWLSDGFLTDFDDEMIHYLFYSAKYAISVEFDRNWDEFPRIGQREKNQQINVRCLKD